MARERTGAEKAFQAMQAIDPEGGWAAFGNLLSGAFDQMTWAEEEVEAAKLRHPDKAAQLHGSFKLTEPTFDLMHTEGVYRGHCRELLERVAAGEDTRPPTAAEISIVCSETSLRGPLHRGAFLVYMRAFKRLFPDKCTQVISDEDLAAAERMDGSEANELQRGLVRRLTVKDRKPPYSFERWSVQEIQLAIDGALEEAS
jgi:hypothetical protein